MNTLGTLRALRRAQKRGDEIGAVALLQGLGGEWRCSYTPFDGGSCTVRWTPPEGSVYEAATAEARGSYRATVYGPSTRGVSREELISHALSLVLTKIAVAVFHHRVEPLMRWAARAAATAVLGV